MNTTPFVSVLLVNYNGKKLLKECLDSVFNQSYPQDSFEVLLLDNDSEDDSVIFVKKNFPNVLVIEAPSNLGFAGGNNEALKHAKGECIVLLNTDVRVDKEWLSQLVAAAKPQNVGIVSSKLYYDLPFVELTIKTPIELKSNIYNVDDFSPLGIIIEDINCKRPERSALVWYQTGFYPPVENNYKSRWTNGLGKVLLPFADDDEETYSISVHGHPHTHDLETPIEFCIGDTVILKDKVHSREVRQFNISLKRREVLPHLKNLVQNAGNIVFKDGYSRDRGSIIKRTSNEIAEFYDFDGEYYNKSKKLLSMCGASTLIKREVIDQVGLFDEAYFMYYEDVDLSLKAWRMGWDIVYAPKSIGYHKHKATTNKQSAVFFHGMLFKNHLFILLTHFSLVHFAIHFLIFMSRFCFDMAVITFIKKIKYYGSYHKIFSTKADSRYLAFQGITKYGMKILNARIYLKKHAKRSRSEMAQYMY